MKRAALWSLLAMGVGALSYWVSTIATVKAQGGEWTPFTVAMVERDYSGSSIKPWKVENYIYAVRRDGSWVRDDKRQIMPHGGWGDMRVVMNYSARTWTTVDPSTESIVTYPYSQKTIAHLSVPPVTCSNDPNAQHATVLGYDTVVVRAQLPAPSGGVASATYWKSPALNCFALKEVWTFRCKTCPAARNTREALVVSEGFPSPALYQIPRNYIERTPSEVLARSAQLNPAEPATPLATRKTLDQIYQSRRQRSQ